MVGRAIAPKVARETLIDIPYGTKAYQALLKDKAPVAEIEARIGFYRKQEQTWEKLAQEVAEKEGGLEKYAYGREQAKVWAEQAQALENLLLKTTIPKAVPEVAIPKAEAGMPQIAIPKAVTPEAIPQAGIPPTKPPVPPITAMGAPSPEAQKLTTLIKAAKPVRAETIEMVTAEKAKRAAAIEVIRGTAEGKEAFYKSLAQLKGEYPKAKFVPPEAQMSPDEVIALFNQIKNAPIDEFAYINTSEALQKLLIGELPQKAELGLLEDIFGSELIRAVLAKRTISEKAWDIVRNTLNLPRAILASFDASAPLRQGVVLAAGHPKQWSKGLIPSIRALFSEKYTLAVDDAIKTSKFYHLGQDNGLYIAPLRRATVRAAEREEAFMTRFAQYIPGVRQSERGYLTFLNKLRQDIFDSVVAGWENTGKTAADYQALARFINHASGRGDLGKMSGLGDILAAGFFSPRLLISRFQLPLDVVFTTPAVRKLVVKDLVAFVGTGATILGLIKLSGAGDVELDPRSSDFGKIRIGNTRLDFWGGFQQIARYVTQFATQQRKTLGRGDIVGVEPIETVGRFLQSKLSPQAGFIVDVLRGETFIGEEMSLEAKNMAQQAWNRLAPLFLQDLADAVRDQGLTGGFIASPGVLGVSVQTFGKSELQRRAEKVSGKPWDMMEPYEKAQIYISPEGRQIIRDEATDEFLKRMKIRWQYYDQQLERDKLFANKEISGSQWREEYQAANAERGTRLAQLDEDFARIRSAPANPQEQALSSYFELMDKYTNPQTGMFDFDNWNIAKDKFLGGLPPEIKNYVERNIGVDSTPTVRRFKQASEMARAYWDIEDQIWAQYPPELRQINEQVLILANTDLRASKMLLKEYPDILRARRLIVYYKKLMRRQNPTIDLYLKVFY